MLSWRTSALLSIVPIGLVVALVLVARPGDPPAHKLPPLPSRAEIARAQAFFKHAEKVCYRSWGEVRKLPEAPRPGQVRSLGPRVVRIHARAIARLEALGAPPPKAAGRFHRALGLLRARNSELRRGLAFFTPGAMAHRSRPEVRRELRRLAARGRRLNAELDRVADPVGLWKCRK